MCNQDDNLYIERDMERDLESWEYHVEVKMFYMRLHL